MELELNLQSKKKLTRWHIYAFCFVLVFVFTIAGNLGFKGINLISPVPVIETFEEVKPKLEIIPNSFNLKTSQSIFESSYASGFYDESNAYAAVDVETGEVLLEKNLEKELPIASLTKIMTAVVALDIVSPDELLTVTPKAASQIPTKIGVVEGQKMKVEELLNALLLTSANDAAEVLKDGINAKYGEEVFIKAMNHKASFLGLESTSFSNPQGFDSRNNYSSARDVAILTAYALKNYPLIEKIASKDYEFLPADKNHKQFDLYNWNGLLGVYPGASGVKIGNTGRAGYTTTVVSEREGKKVLVVLLGAPGVLERDLWASQILDKAFEKYDLEPASISEYELKQKYGTWKYWN